MFGIGLGEILLILFIVFLIAPRDIPKVMRKIGQFFNALDKLRNEVADIEREVMDVSREIKDAGRVGRRKNGAPPVPARPAAEPPPASTLIPPPAAAARTSTLKKTNARIKPAAARKGRSTGKSAARTKRPAQE